MESNLQSRVQEFKDFHKITSDINQHFKLDNGLKVQYNNQWFSLTKQNNSFYAKLTLKKHGADFLRAVGLAPGLAPGKAPVYQAPSMNDLKNEMMQEYIIDTPVPQDSHKPLKPLKRALTTQTLDFKQTPFTIGNYLKGYEMNMPLGYATEKDPNFFF
jgi:hypothetical protein